MLVHLRNNSQIVQYWPLFKDAFSRICMEECNGNPSFLNNILTHALIHHDSYQLHLYYTGSESSSPASLWVFDITFDKLRERSICDVLLWEALRQLDALELRECIEEVLAWAKNSGCEEISGRSFKEELTKGEMAILSRMGKRPKALYGFTCEL